MRDTDVKSAIISALEEMASEEWGGIALITTGVGKLNKELNEKGKGKE